MMSKGQTGIELAVIAIMMLVGVMVLFLPTLFYHFSSQINIQYQYHYDNAQSLLLSLLSTNVATAQQPTLELLGDYIQLSNQRPDITPIETELGRLANAISVNCYELSVSSPISTTTQSSITSTSSTTSTTSTTDIISGSCTKYQASATIPLPYNPSNLLETVTLVIEK